MQTIRVVVPRSSRPLTILRMKHSQGESQTEVDVDAIREIEIELPEGGMDLVVVKAAGKAEDKAAKKPEAKRDSRKAPKADEKPADPPAPVTPDADKPAEDKPADDAAKS
jgi:hypothetical protein